MKKAPKYIAIGCEGSVYMVPAVRSPRHAFNTLIGAFDPFQSRNIVQISDVFVMLFNR